MLHSPFTSVQSLLESTLKKHVKTLDVSDFVVRAVRKQCIGAVAKASGSSGICNSRSTLVAVSHMWHQEE